MSDLAWINDFSEKTRGTYRVKSDENGSEIQKLAIAKNLIKGIALDAGITILLDAKMQGNGWILVWWPASEPRHNETDQIITPTKE